MGVNFLYWMNQDDGCSSFQIVDVFFLGLQKLRGARMVSQMFLYMQTRLNLHLSTKQIIECKLYLKHNVTFIFSLI